MTRYFLKAGLLFAAILIVSCSGNEKGENIAQHNHLINEKSPYLLQHAHNPVDWYPWSEAALEKAKKEDKLIIISIGYASCHWCHVMEKESFSDTAVSRLMNDNFVSIKVDREERPDIDNIYMTACQIAQGDGCGWPLNAIALPDGRPVYAGTYYPKAEWMRLLEYFVKMYAEEPDKLRSFSEQMTDGIRQNEIEGLTGQEHIWSPEGLDSVMTRIQEQIDMELGGKKGAPKFPMPNNFSLLLQHHYLTGDAVSLEAMQITLSAMASGGIYDHLGGGFSRYSTDPGWKIPHFEKMLYDNAQLVSLYANAYQLNANRDYERVIRSTLEFVDSELSESNGGFFSSIDADSEGEEGTFYIWTDEEIKEILKDRNLYELAKRIYGFSPEGNWEDGKNILFLNADIIDLIIEMGLSEEEILPKINKINNLLIAARKERIRPHTDDKVLTSWNSMMIRGYLDAFLALGDESYLGTARKNIEFIETHMFKSDSSLWRTYRDGDSGIDAFLEDYAQLISAYIKFYQVTFDESYLRKAEKLTYYVLEHFQDEDGFFLFSKKEGSSLIARKKEISDNVIPSSNSVMATNLYVLGTLLFQEEWIEMSKSMVSKVMVQIRESDYPSYYSNWMQLAFMMSYPLYEVAIVGENAADINTQMQRHYLPNALFLGGKQEGSMELLKDKLQEGETFIYVCRNKVCKLPVQEVEAALQLVSPR